jgi:DNA-binding transcriptional ArsR family regulator
LLNQTLLVRIGKGVGNARRLAILELLAKRRDLSLTQIAQDCRGDIRTIAEHVRKLTLAGLVMKRRAGPIVEHAISPRGRKVLRFLRALD